MESVLRARQRLRQLPRHLKACPTPAAAYARCVCLKEAVLQGECQREYEELTRCLKDAAKKAGTRL